MWNTYTTFCFNVIFFGEYIFAFADTLLSSLTFVSLFFIFLFFIYANAILLYYFDIVTSHHDLKSWFQLLSGVYGKTMHFFFFG